MSDVIVRQWGPNCYAAYVVGSGAYPEFVGVESSRTDAAKLAESRCAAIDPDGASGDSEHAFGREWSEERDGPRNSTTPARLAPASPGAAP